MRSLLQVLPCAFLIATPTGNHCTQVGHPRFDRRATAAIQRRQCLISTANIEKDTRARNNGIDQPGLQFQRTLVVSQRLGQVARGMEDRRPRVPGHRNVRAQLDRAFSKRLRP